MSKIAIGLLILFSYLAFIYGISAYPIADMNEGLYAEIAREMLVRKDFIIPHLNFVPYLEKPPMLYWLIAISYKMFGVTTFAARIIPGLSALTVTSMLVWFCNKLQKRTIGWLAGMLLATSAGYIIIARVVFFDLLLTAFLTVGLCCYYLWYTYAQRKYLLLAYASMGLVFLTKGFIGLMLAALIVGSFFLITKTPREKIYQFLDPLGMGILLLIVAPWHILASLKLPTFFHDFVINEQLYRFFNQRIPHDYHTGPLYFYLPRILVYLFPWSLLLPLVFKKRDAFTLFLWLWLLVPLVLFSISGAKGDYYMVLSMPALAILLAETIAEHKMRVLLYHFYVTIAILIASMCLGHHILPPDTYYIFNQLLVWFLGCLLISFVLPKNPFIIFLLTGCVMLGTVIAYVAFEQQRQNYYNQSTITNYIKTHDHQRPVVLFKDYERLATVLLFLAKPIPIVESVSQDLYYGSQTPAALGKFLSYHDLTKLCQAPIYIITHKDNLPLLTIPGLRVLTRSSKALLLGN